MPVIKPRLCQLSFALLFGAVAVGACSVDNARLAASDCVGLSCGSLGPPAPVQNVPVYSSNASDASVPPSSPAKAACGAGSCLPDDGLACENHVPTPAPVVPPSSNGALDAGLPSTGVDGGVDGGSAGPALDGSFAEPTQPDVTPSKFACQVSVENRAVVRQCGAAGLQGVEEPCTSSQDCRSGLGCVGGLNSGRCLPFCCAVDGDSCPTDFYCTERPLRSEPFRETNAPLVPVCERADNCSLSEPFDCEGPRCVCGPDTACALVSPDGTTACLPPGTGEAGDPCPASNPCKHGYHCSQATSPGTCVKICDLDQENSEACGSGVCQATPLLPDGWGTCVGAVPSEMNSR